MKLILVRPRRPWIGRLRYVWCFFLPAILLPVAPAAALHQAPLLIFGQPVEIVDGAIHFTGRVTYSQPGVVSSAKGAIQLAAQLVRWPDAQHPVYTLRGIGLSGRINFNRTAPAMSQLSLTGGTIQIGRFDWNNYGVDSIRGLINYAGQRLVIKNCHGLYRKHPWTMNASYDSARGIARVHLQMTDVNQRRLFQFFAPSKLDVDGPAALTANITWHRDGHFTGELSLTATGPGMLKIKSVPILTQRVVNAYGRNMAMLMMEDLREYPYVKESLTATENSHGMVIRYSFIRGKGNPQNLKPRLVNIDGREVLFRPRDLKSYSNTITLPGTGIRKLLKLCHEFTSPDHH